MSDIKCISQKQGSIGKQGMRGSLALSQPIQCPTMSHDVLVRLGSLGCGLTETLQIVRTSCQSRLTRSCE